MAKTIYEGSDDDFIDENIDEVILRLLGLEDVFDLDYETYKSLLKEGMMAGRMRSTKMSSEETEKLTDEFKRVKQKSGRFKIKERKINVSSFTRQKPKDTRTYTGPQRRLKPAKTQQGQKTGAGLIQSIFGFDPETGEDVEGVEEKVKATRVKKKKDRDSVMDFLKKVLAPSLTKIEKNLVSILDVMTQQSELKEESQEKARVTGEKEEKREREEKSEEGALSKFGEGLKEKVTKPFTDFFEIIKKFFLNILYGALALKLIDILQNPKKFFADLINPVINFFNEFIKFVWDKIFFIPNFFIDRINEGLSGLGSILNGILSKIGQEEVEIPVIPTFEAPQIPLIEVPEEPEEKPAEGMTGGGQVDQNTGEKITGMGKDTQLVALEPGEVVMSKKAVDAYGAETLLAMNADAGGTNTPTQGKVLGYSGGGIVEHLHGDPSRPGYRADHGSVSNAHDHFAFATEELRKAVQNGLANGEGPSGRKYQIGSTTGGKHANQSYHYVGKAFDIPWSQFGSGAISQKDFDQSATLLKDVQTLVAKNGGGSSAPSKPTSSGPTTNKSPRSGSRPSRWSFPLTLEGSKQYNQAISDWESGGSSSQPQTPMVPGSGSSGGGGGMGSATFNVIAAGEGDYNSVNRGRAGDSPGGASKYFGRNLTDMTVSEVMSLQSSGQLYAAGKYQIIPKTMKGFVSKMGIKGSDMYDAGTQEKFKEYVINHKRPEVGKYLRGETNDPTEAAQALAREFASVGLQYAEAGRPRGSSRYAGKGGNRASISPESIIKALKQDKSGGGVTPSSTSSTPSSGSSAPSVTPTSSGGMGIKRPEDIPPSVGPASTGSPMMSSTSRTRPPGPPNHSCPPKAPKIVAPPKAPSQGGSSAAIGNPSKKDGFSPIDLGNPDLIVVRSIYNIVG